MLQYLWILHVQMDSFLNTLWLDPNQGSFAAPATANAVKNRKNPELAQHFIQYPISHETHSKIARAMNKASVSENAAVDESLETYLAFVNSTMSSPKEFDEKFISNPKADCFDVFQITVSVL